MLDVVPTNKNPCCNRCAALWQCRSGHVKSGCFTWQQHQLEATSRQLPSWERFRGDSCCVDHKHAEGQPCRGANSIVESQDLCGWRPECRPNAVATAILFSKSIGWGSARRGGCYCTPRCRPSAVATAILLPDSIENGRERRRASYCVLHDR